MLALEIGLPLGIIVGCLLIGLIVDLKNGDKVFRHTKKGGKHGKYS